MTRASPTTSEETVRIVRAMNRYETMTVEVEGSNETRHLVEYEESDLQSTLAALPEGTSIPVTMRRINCRSNAWRAIDLGSGRRVPAGAATTSN